MASIQKKCHLLHENGSLFRLTRGFLRPGPNEGMTLIEVVIALAVSSVIIYGVSTMMLSTSKLGASMNSRLDMLNASNYVQAIMANPVSCLTALSGVNSLPSPAVGPAIGVNIGDSTDITLHTLATLPTAIISANLSFGFSTFNKVQLVTDQVTSYAPVMSAANTVYSGHMNLALNRPQALSSAPLTYSSPNLFFELNPLNQLVACSTTWKGATKTCYNSNFASNGVVTYSGSAYTMNAIAYCNGTDTVSVGTGGYSANISGNGLVTATQAAVTNPNGWSVTLHWPNSWPTNPQNFSAYVACCD